jgi:hypothetical protein
LWDFSIRARLDSMYEVGEEDGILDEENGDVIADNI